MKFARLDPVVKVRGYKFPGLVVAAYQTLSGEDRYVVECTLPGAEGIQHIFNEDQLGLADITPIPVVTNVGSAGPDGWDQPIGAWEALKTFMGFGRT